MAEMLGYEREELIGKPVSDLVAPESRDEVAARQREGVNEPYEHIALRKDGSVFSVEVRARSMQYRGRTVRFSILHDLTQRKKAEAVLRERESYFRSLVENAQDLITVVDELGIIQYQTPSAVDVLGYQPEERIGKSLFEQVHPDDRESAIRLFTEGVKSPGEPRSSISRARHRDGTWRVLESIGTAYRKEDGSLIGVINSRDITERVEAEEALRESEARYRGVVEGQTEFIVRWLPDGTRTFVNQAYCDFFGVPREELIGTNIFPLIAEEDCEAVQAKIDGITPDRPAATDVHRVIRPDGAVAWQEWTDRGIFDDDGNVVEFQSVGRDITEQVQADEDRQRLEAQLRQGSKMEALGTLAGGIAHDFNNMLMVIQGYSELVRDEVERDAPASKRIDQVLKAAERARDLVRQILVYSRQSEPELAATDLHEVVREAVRLLRATLPTTIEIRDRLEIGTAKVLADASQIHQVILNLGSNASHAMRDQGGVLEVTLEGVEVDESLAEELGSVAVGSYAKLVVRDTGCGMDSEVIERIFDPFFTTKEVGQGTGLGLSMVQGIVTKHDGTIDVETELGKGTAFHIYLPLVEEGAQRISNPPGTIPAGSERVLFVDDEEQLASLGEMMLGPLGYTTTIRTGSKEALELFRSRPSDFDIIVADYTMPHMTGVELARECKRVQPDIPIILATGFAETLAEDMVARENITSFIAKPYRAADLARAIRDVFDGAE
jgi:PAS domain S-box-containing protein